MSKEKNNPAESDYREVTSVEEIAAALDAAADWAAGQDGYGDTAAPLRNLAVAVRAGTVPVVPCKWSPRAPWSSGCAVALAHGIDPLAAVRP